MAIKVKCPSCGREIRAGDHLAGKSVRCPDCKETVAVPGVALEFTADSGRDVHGAANPKSAAAPSGKKSASGPWRDTDDSPVPPSAASSAPAPWPVYSLSDPAVWLVKSPDGRVLGPIPRSQLDEWAEDGRLHPNSQIWAEGGRQSYLAGQIYPFLVPAAPPPQRVHDPAAVAMLNADAYLPRDTTSDEARLERRRRRKQDLRWRRIEYMLGLIPIWVYLTAATLGLMLISLIGMVVSPQVAAVFTLGWYLLGVLLMAYANIMILAAAGSEDWFCLLLIFICPGYIWYYMATRFDDLWNVILVELLGIGCVIYGTLILRYWHQTLWFDF